MKYLLLNTFTFFLFTVNAQETYLDSLSVSNDSLDSILTQITTNYQKEGIDFIILREYDSLYPVNSLCTIIYRRDSCSSKFGLTLDIENLSANYLTIRSPVERKKWKCEDDIQKIQGDLSNFENYFTKNIVYPIDYSANRFTLYGKIDGEFVYEVFDSELVSKHHTGMLHNIISYYFGK